MGNTLEYRYGPVSDYSIKMNMSELPGRGWTWGVWNAPTPIASLSNSGNMQIAGKFTVTANFAPIEAFVTKNKHLPEVPSSDEMRENGVNLKEMNFTAIKEG